jgi:UDP-arabinose 4-epimerase
MKGKVLVTGGAGYIGSHAAKALAHAGYLPVTYDNLSIGNRWAVRWGPFELGDILDSNRLGQVFRKHQPVAVMHFAALALVAESVVEPSLYYRTNVAGALNLVDAARAHDVETFVFSSTCAVYGVPAILPIAEDCPKEPINPYGASKLMVERVLEDYDAAYGLKHASLRYFNAAGADPDGDIGECRVVETHLIPLALDAAVGAGSSITIMGVDYPTIDGTAVRDYIHVTDLAAGHVAALEHVRAHGSSLTLNFGTGVGHSVREVLACIEHVTGRPLHARTAPRRSGDPAVLVADPTRSRGLLGLTLPHSRCLEHMVETAWCWRSQRRAALAG